MQTTVSLYKLIGIGTIAQTETVYKSCVHIFIYSLYILSVVVIVFCVYVVMYVIYLGSMLAGNYLCL